MIKNSIISCSFGEDIIDVVVGARGPEADKNLLSQQQTKFSTSQGFIGDKAYLGASNTITPTKKPPKRELTPEQKVRNAPPGKLLNLIQENLAEKNQQISKQRIFIEHLIRRLKIFRLAGDKFRLSAKNYPLAIYTICGLVRLRLGTNSWLFEK